MLPLSINIADYQNCKKSAYYVFHIEYYPTPKFHSTGFIGFPSPPSSNIFPVVDVHTVNKSVQEIQVFFLHKMSITDHLRHSSKNAGHSLKI